ncbi:MAG: UvrD-helicase domain-containing protein [Prevotellaceae bacterium]|jgi:ATP-dependent exoDNAse (exonuclease V) beta subunit|nr:UvrD-helicase domain-containing protein [Prevotellaceae bacterium]
MSKPIQLELFGTPSKSGFSPIPGGLTVYGASAGSGKTYTLTLEYLKQALSGGYNANRFREILAVTFTNKATDEMKIRIISTLNGIATGSSSVDKVSEAICSELNIDPQTLKDRAIKVQQAILHNYSSFSISTIDKFFQKIIHSFVREAGLRPGFRLELDYDRLISEAIDRMMLNIHRNDFLYRHISDIIDGQMERGHNWDIRKSLKSRGYEILKEQFHEFDSQFHAKISDAAFMSGFSVELKKITDDFEKKLTSFAGGAVSIIKYAELRKSDFCQGENGPVNYFYKLKKGDYSLPVKAVDDLLDKDDDDAWCGKKVSEIVKTDIRQISGQLSGLLREAVEYHRENYRRYFTAVCIKKAMADLGFFAEMEANIREVANEENLMPISETTHLLGKLINENDAPFIYERAGTRYGVFMIDEFQDTSEAQWRNFKPLLKNSLSEGRSSLVVGDVKQSIYRWRNGDWRILAHKIFSDFSNFTVREKNLDTNWRSFPNVIEFNNALFSALPAYVEKVFSSPPTSGAGINVLGDAYRNVGQKICEKNRDKGGYVSMSLIIDEKKAKDKILEQLPKLIADMQDRGYRAGDIAILVRDANDGRMVSDCLLNCADSDTEHCFDIVYQDALLVKKSASVKFIISLMKAALNPDDMVNNALINYFLNRNQSGFKWDSSGILDSGLKKQLSELASLSLPEVFERLVRVFDLGNDPVEIPYIQELHDTLISFSNSEIPDISSFIEYWDAESGRMNLPEGKTPDAISISTIHKAKGLEYPVVIIPFCNWSMKPKSSATTVWLSPAEEPFSQLQYVPVSYGNDMKNSYFEQEYYYETIQSLIDNLNLLYVSFTRAKEELHIMLPLSSPPEKREGQFAGTAASLLADFMLRNPAFMQNSLKRKPLAGKDMCYVFGEKQYKRENRKEDAFSGILVTNYNSSVFDKKLSLKYESENYFTAQASPVQLKNYGILMHKAFSLIRSAKDAPAAIDSIVEDGLIEREQLPELRNRVARALHFAEKWFADDSPYEIITEKFLLLPASMNKGLSRRPDRIMSSENETLVIDYKFGTSMEDSHKAQVRNYMDLLKLMQYPDVRGYVWYVDMDSIEKTF